MRGNRTVGQAQLDVARAAATAPRAVPSLQPMGGSGSLDTARGTQRLVLDGVELRGDRDIFGTPFDSRRHAAASSQARAWDGGTWNGKTWTGADWNGKTWTGAEWNGKTWTGPDWNGKSWTGAAWDGKTWTGAAWQGHSWTGADWHG